MVCRCLLRVFTFTFFPASAHGNITCSIDVNSAKDLKYVWQFFNIMNEGLNPFPPNDTFYVPAKPCTAVTPEQKVCKKESIQNRPATVELQPESSTAEFF